jgi:hypothetical protein
VITFFVNLFDPMNILFYAAIGAFSKKFSHCIMIAVGVGILLRFFVAMIAKHDQASMTGLSHFLGILSTVCGSLIVYSIASYFRKQKTKSSET